MTTSQKLLAVINAIHATPPELHNLYSAYRGLQHMAATAEETARLHLLSMGANTHSKGDAQAAGDTIGSSWARGGGDDVNYLSKVYAGLRACEASPDFAAAVATLEPMEAERERLKELEIAEAAEISKARGDAEQAHFAALARAAEAAENDAEVLKTRAALAALDPSAPAPPPPLVRGRQKLSAGAEMAED